MTCVVRERHVIRILFALLTCAYRRPADGINEASGSPEPHKPPKACISGPVAPASCLIKMRQTVDQGSRRQVVGRQPSSFQNCLWSVESALREQSGGTDSCFF